MTPAGVIVSSKEAQWASLTESCLKGEGNQVGLWIVRLTHASIGVGSRGVEVPQGSDSDAFSLSYRIQHLLHHEFGLAVGTHRTFGVVLVQGKVIGSSVDSAGG